MYHFCVLPVSVSVFSLITFSFLLSMNLHLLLALASYPKIRNVRPSFVPLLLLCYYNIFSSLCRFSYHIAKQTRSVFYASFVPCIEMYVIHVQCMPGCMSVRSKCMGEFTQLWHFICFMFACCSLSLCLFVCSISHCDIFVRVPRNGQDKLQTNV